MNMMVHVPTERITRVPQRPRGRVPHAPVRPPDTTITIGAHASTVRKPLIIVVATFLAGMAIGRWWRLYGDQYLPDCTETPRPPSRLELDDVENLECPETPSPTTEGAGELSSSSRRFVLNSHDDMPNNLPQALYQRSPSHQAPIPRRVIKRASSVLSCRRTLDVAA